MASELTRFEPGPGDRAPAALASERGDLPLRAVTVRAQITGVTADVDVEQVFDNPWDEALEVSYVFPLPELAAVTRCELHLDGRVVAARLEERGAAREAYAAAVERGQRAALAEQDRPGVFTITLGNVPPRGRATIRFGMAYALPREDGRHVFRFPLVVAERYAPGDPIPGERVGHGTHPDTTASPDASRVTPPRLAADATRPVLAVEVAIAHGELGIDDVESSLHAVQDVVEPGRRVVRLAPGQLMDRDFVLRFRLGDDAIRTQLATQADPTGDEGTFQLTLVPPAAPIRARPRDLVLLLDRSGSMAGWKIVAARRALARMIEVLDDADRFAAYAFSSQMVAPAELAFGLAPPRGRDAARAGRGVPGRAFGRGWNRDGSPVPARDHAARERRSRPRPLARAGHRRSGHERGRAGRARRELARRQGPRARDLTTRSTRPCCGRLAATTGGRVEIVQQASELEDALDRLHVLIAAPALERVTVEGDGVLVDTVVPAGPLHAFPGVPLVVRGRYRGALASVRIGASLRREPFALAVAAERSEVAALRTCWAREQLLALEDRFAAQAVGRSALVPQIVGTSIRFGVLCRFTAFVAVDDRGALEAPATRHVQQPVEATGAAPAIAAHSQLGTPRWGGAPAAAVQTQTRSGTMRGKIAYLSPEQARGQRLSPAHEVYMLARLLWELLTGTRLIPPDDAFAMLSAIVHGDLPVPLLPPALSTLEPVLRRALDTDPAKRYASPIELVRAIEPIVAGAPVNEVAAWLANLGGARLAEQRLMLARLAGVRPPPGGYVILDWFGMTNDADQYVAVRSGPGGAQAVLLRRLLPHVAEAPDLVERFLSEASIAADGIAHTDDAGTDSGGSVFLAQPFIPGLDLREILAELSTRSIGTPGAIAVAIIAAAARALEHLLALPAAGGATVSMLLDDLAPTSLRVGLDGRPVWTSLGLAPSPAYTAARRLAVPLAVAAGVTLGNRHTPDSLEAHGRWVVVPASVRIAPSAPTPAPGRRRWWRE